MPGCLESSAKSMGEKRSKQYLCVPDSVNPDIAGNMCVRDSMYSHITHTRQYLSVPDPFTPDNVSLNILCMHLPKCT